MVKIYLMKVRSVLLFVVLGLFSRTAVSQTSMPQELTNGTIQEQLNFLEQKTRIYEFYRAIREDMFQKVKLNLTDTLSVNYNNILLLKKENSLLKYTIDTLTSNLESTKVSLSEMTDTKNSIKILGLEVNKTSYNSVMWIIVAALLAILAFGFMVFKRNLVITTNRKNELDELKQEFETYRKTTREAREKMSMEHFKEIQRIKGVQ
jgi:hypothetical protein